MTIPDGYLDLAPGKIASVVTYLEMREPPASSTIPAPPGLSIRKVPTPDLDWYRQLYRAVGEDWLWFRRLRLRDEDLKRAIHDPKVDVFALSVTEDVGSSDKGLLELDRSVRGENAENEVEIAYFGLTSDLIGRGAGKYMMAHALHEAWASSPQRVWVHTCTLDHPKALSFYLKAGFVPYGRAIEIADDPRLTGDAPRNAAKHVPIIEPL